VPRVHRGRIPEDGFVTVVATNPHERELSADSQSFSSIILSSRGRATSAAQGGRPPPFWAPAVSVPFEIQHLIWLGSQRLAPLRHADQL
jgi:hypothetical protein